MNGIQRPRRVFLSNSHDSEAHRERVLALATQLRAQGVDAWLDRFVQSPAEGWIRWMEREVGAADFVLVVCTPTYRRRFEGKEDAGRGLGVNFEGATIQKLIYDAQGDLAGARAHQEAVLDAWRRLLGDEHPDTLTARLNLAHTLDALMARDTSKNAEGDEGRLP